MVVAADMFALLVGVVAIMAATVQAGYLLQSRSASVGLPHSHKSLYSSSYSQPSSFASYVTSHNSPYAVRSHSASIVASQSAHYFSDPLAIGNSALYSRSAQAPYTSAHYSSSESANLPNSQSVHYANSQSALPSSQNINYISSQSVPLLNSQSANYELSHSVPLPSSQSDPLSNSQSFNYALSHNVPLASSQSVNYASSQSAPLASQNVPLLSSQSVSLPITQSINYVPSQNSPQANSHSQSSLFSAGRDFPTVNQISPYTTGQNSYTASQNSPHVSSQSSYITSHNNPYTANQGTYVSSQNNPYQASQTPYLASSQSDSRSAGQVASYASSQSAIPIIGQSTHLQVDSDYLRQHSKGRYQYQTGSSPVVNQQGTNYQIVHHVSESNDHQDHSHRQNLVTTQTVSHQTGADVIDQSYSSVYAGQISPPAMPVVTKHIYFHEPPPDMEQTPLQSIPSVPPKKVYNIVFIKVPAQESRRINSAAVQALSASQPHIEDKTLIYVLVKKPEYQPLPRPPVSSEHEVFYVKYKGDVNEVANQINGKLSTQTTLQSDVQAVIEPVLQTTGAGNNQPAVQHSLPTLQTGFVNSHLM